MTPEERAEALAAAARIMRPDLVALAEELATGDVTLVHGPQPQTIMLELEGPTGAFCLGETVITSCTARVDGADGHGWVLGFDREAALAAAVCDAAAGDRVEALAGAARRAEQAERAARDAAVAETEVRLG